MSYQFSSLLDNETEIPALTNADEFRRLVQRLLHHDAPRFRRRWNYYRNPLTLAVARSDDASSDRPYRQAQEWGLPARITGVDNSDSVSRKEVVVENDIGWRIETLVDYLFGRAVTINSAAPDAKRREVIEKLLRAIFAPHGGIVFLQQIALMGAVYGFVDILVKFDATAAKEISSDTLIDLSTANLSTGSAGLSERARPSSTDESVPPDAEPAPPPMILR